VKIVGGELFMNVTKEKLPEIIEKARESGGD
jgi:hypothetical protein